MMFRERRNGPVYYTGKTGLRAALRFVSLPAHALSAASRYVMREIILTMETESGRMMTLKVGE
jgi:hypothetical protein